MSQSYKYFKILFIDDASNYSQYQRHIIKDKLRNHTAVFNKQRKYSVYNSYFMINRYAKIDHSVVLNLDGDDWLINKGVLSYLSNIYTMEKCLFTYGDCVLWDGFTLSRPSRFERQYINTPYPKKVVSDKKYRKYPFLPLHPRSWKVWLYKKIKKSDFLRPDGTWLRFAEDQAIFYPMLEMAFDKLKVIKKPLYVYNTASQNSDNKKNLFFLLRDELIVRKKRLYPSI